MLETRTVGKNVRMIRISSEIIRTEEARMKNRKHLSCFRNVKKLLLICLLCVCADKKAKSEKQKYLYR